MMWFLAAQMYCSVDCEGGTSNWFPLKTSSLMVSIYAEYNDKTVKSRERCYESCKKNSPLVHS